MINQPSESQSQLAPHLSEAPSPAPDGLPRVDDRALRAFVSPLLFRDAAAGEETFGAIIQVDIGGFTRAVEEYSQRGSAALEDVANLIGSCFKVLVDTVTRYGAAAHTFPGDGLIAVWEAPEDGLYDVVSSARECALTLVESYPTSRRFPLKAGLGAGAIQIIALGAPGTRRELLVTGPAMRDASTVMGRAGRGKALLSAYAERLAPRKSRQTGALARRATGLRAPVLDMAAAMRPLAHAAGPLDFMPRLVRQRLDAGLGGWTGGFRHVSTAFVEVGAGTTFGAATIRRIYDEVQRCVGESDGTIVQFCHDDKGLVCMLAFGVESSHEDDADRALSTSFALHECLTALGFPSAAGITTGRIFCGLLGDERRLEFRLIGTAVNLAARMMAMGGGVLCDDATRSLARRFAFAQPLTLRDRKGRLVAQRPQVRYTTAITVPERFRRGAAAERTCGRVSEIATVESWLRAVGSTASARVLTLMGDAGIGKTQIASNLAHRAQAESFRVLVCQNEESGPGLALRGFLPAVEQMFDLGDLPLSLRRRRIVDAVIEATGSAELAPLLEDVCALGIEENPTTTAMTGSNRADNRLTLLSRLFQLAAESSFKRGRPTVLFLEDAHWMDAASWILLDVLSGINLLPMHFVLTLRSLPSEIPTAAALVNGERTTLIRLGPLGSVDTGVLIAERMRAAQATPQLVAAVYRHAEGNPLFCCEVIRSLAERALIFVDGGTARLASHVNDIGAIAPESVEKVLQARIDRLPAAQQWLLKCASVIGARFESSMLRSMQTHVAGSNLDAAVAALVDAELFDCQPGEGEASLIYAFRHATVRDVAYTTLLHEQQRELHAAIGLAMEADPVASRSLQSIFSHWRAAGESWRALRYVESGGNAATREGDYRAAREFFEFGVKTLADVPHHDGEERLARWSHQLGEVLVAMGRHAQARVHLDTALRLMGETVPSRRATAVALTLLELLRQYRQRRTVSFIRDSSGASTAQRCAEIYEQLGYVFYASGDTLRGVHAALAMLNRAERAPLASVRARAFAAMSLTVSVTPFRRFGNLYEDAARRAAQELGDNAVVGWVEWIASLRAAGEGRWIQLLEETACAIDIAKRTADPRLAVMGNLTRAWALRLQGELGQAWELARFALDTARAHGNLLWEAWALLIESECDMARHAYEAVIKSSQRALDILVEESDRTEEIRAGGLLAAALFAQGHETRALRVAETAARSIKKVDLTSFIMLEGFAGVAEVHVSRFERACVEGRGRVDGGTRRGALGACADLARYARVFPVGHSRAWLLRGRLLFATGEQSAAEAALRQAVREADRLSIPRDRMLALRVLETHGASLAD